MEFCFAHCQITGIYHYHTGSGCMVNPLNCTIASCANSSCHTNIGNYIISFFNNYQTMTTIGIGKDGHVVYEPYLSSTNRVTSGFDICSGIFYGFKGYCAYFATSTYPYLVGYFGLGNYLSFGPNCSSNGV